MVDVQQNTLGAFEQDAASAPASLVQIAPHRLGERQHELGDFAQLRQERTAVDRRFPKTGPKRVMVCA